MKRLAALSLSLSLIFPSSAFASTRTIFAATAAGTNGAIMTLEVALGQGLNLNLIPTGEMVKKAWIDDPSRITLSFDGNLCQPTSDNQQAPCTDQSGATVVHLRQIKPIDFPALPRSRNGVTLLTLVTEGASGRKLYQFKVVPISGEPKYTTVTIEPNPERLTPIIPPNQTAINDSTWQLQAQVPELNTNTPAFTQQISTGAAVTQAVKASPTVLQQIPTLPSVTKVAYSQQAISNANAAVYGLVVARHKGQIMPRTSTWIKAQKAIGQLRQGKSTFEAATSAKLPVTVLNQLIAWGQKRP